MRTLAEYQERVRQVMEESMKVGSESANSSLSPNDKLLVVATAMQVTLTTQTAFLKALLEELIEFRRLVAEQANAAGSDPASSGGSIPPGATKI
jgi:hypothetical protein